MKYEKLVTSLPWRRTMRGGNTVLVADKGRWHFRVGHVVYKKWFKKDIERYFLHVEHGGIRTRSGELVGATSVYYDEGDDAEQLFVEVLVKVYDDKEARQQELLEMFERAYLT